MSEIAELEVMKRINYNFSRRVKLAKFCISPVSDVLCKSLEHKPTNYRHKQTYIWNFNIIITIYKPVSRLYSVLRSSKSPMAGRTNRPQVDVWKLPKQEIYSKTTSDIYL